MWIKYLRKALQENEDARKMGEQRSNQAEEALEDLEAQLEDAQAVANQDSSEIHNIFFAFFSRGTICPKTLKLKFSQIREP